MAGQMRALIERVQPPSVFGQITLHEHRGKISISGQSKMKAVADFAQAYSDLYLLGKTFDAKLKPFVFLTPKEPSRAFGGAFSIWEI